MKKRQALLLLLKKNGSKITIDTQMEKIAVNFSYNAETQQIILTLIDGTKQYIDLTALITQYEFWTVTRWHFRLTAPVKYLQS